MLIVKKFILTNVQDVQNIMRTPQKLSICFAYDGPILEVSYVNGEPEELSISENVANVLIANGMSYTRPGSIVSLLPLSWRKQIFLIISIIITSIKRLFNF